MFSLIIGIGLTVGAIFLLYALIKIDVDDSDEL